MFSLDLPLDAKNTLINDKPDDFFDDGNLAPKLGYEVIMRTLDFFFMGDKSDDLVATGQVSMFT